MNSYQKWLVSQNATTGHLMWKIVFGIAVLFILVWTALVLPAAISFAGFETFLGRAVDLSDGNVGFMLYGRWILPDPIGSYYMVGVVFSLVFVKMAWLIAEFSNNFANGYIYEMPRRGSPLGEWRKIK